MEMTQISARPCRGAGHREPQGAARRARPAAPARLPRPHRHRRGGRDDGVRGRAAVAQDSPPATGGTTSGSSSATGGVSVSAIQRALGLPADGVYGRKTKAAVRRFQRRHGLDVDGVVGPATLAALGLSADSTDDGDATDSAERGPARRTGERHGHGRRDRGAREDRPVRVGRHPAAISRRRPVPRQVPVRPGDLGAMGGTGDPAAAPEAEQDRIAAKLYAERGAAPWPVCG